MEKQVVSLSQDTVLKSTSKKEIQFSAPIGKTTRKKNIDFSKLGQKITLSNTSCHKCKTMIPADEENICQGPLINNSGKGSNKKKFEPCTRRFCNECLQKQYRDSWLQKQKNPDSWICPVCLGTCNCSQCTRKRTKESQLKNQFLAQFDSPDKLNKRNEKLQNKQKLQKAVADIKKGKKPLTEFSKQQTTVEMKQAVTEEDWNAFLESKKNFYDCLNKYDWSYIPKLQQLKDQLNESNEEKKESEVIDDQ